MEGVALVVCLAPPTSCPGNLISIPQDYVLYTCACTCMAVGASIVGCLTVHISLAQCIQQHVYDTDRLKCLHRSGIMSMIHEDRLKMCIQTWRNNVLVYT